MKLGKNQQVVLNSLAGTSNGRTTYPSGGWHFGSHSTAVRILDSLVVKGFVGVSTTNSGMDVYNITEDGYSNSLQGRHEARMEYLTSLSK